MILHVHKSHKKNLVGVANNFANNIVGEKANRKHFFWQIFDERCPHKGVPFDKVDTNSGYLTLMKNCTPYNQFVNTLGSLR